MGVLSYLWPFSSGPQSDNDRRAADVRSGAAVPSRAERQRCWDSRDLYFGCLDRASIIDAVSTAGAAAAQKACGAESAQVDLDCAAQWVAHFKKYRVANHQKEQRLAQLRAQGAQMVEVPTGPGSPVPKR